MAMRGTGTLQVFRSLVHPALTIVLGVLLVAHAFLLREERRGRLAAALVRAGDLLPVLSAISASGDPLALADPSEGRVEVLLVVAPGCAYCTQSAPAWRELAALADLRPHVSVVAVTGHSAAGLAAFLSEHGVAIPAARLARVRDIFAVRADVVPQVLVVLHGGRVAASHSGVLRPEGSAWVALLGAMGPRVAPSALVIPRTSAAGGQTAFSASSPLSWEVVR